MKTTNPPEGGLVARLASMGYLPVPPVLGELPDAPEVPDVPDMPEEPDLPDDDPVEPLDRPVEPVDAGGALVSFDDVSSTRDDPVAPLVVPVPVDNPVVELLPERRAFSRAMHASRSAIGAFWQIIVGSPARLAGTRLPVVGLLVVDPGVMPDMPDVAPLLPPEVLPVCAVTAVAVPSAMANANALSCILVMIRSPREVDS